MKVEKQINTFLYYIILMSSGKYILSMTITLISFLIIAVAILIIF